MQHYLLTRMSEIKYYLGIVKEIIADFARPEESTDSQSEDPATVSNLDSNDAADVSDTTAQSLSVQSMSGFATAWLEGRTETLLAYYQDEAGAIIENRFNKGE